MLEIDRVYYGGVKAIKDTLTHFGVDTTLLELYRAEPEPPSADEMEMLAQLRRSSDGDIEYEAMLTEEDEEEIDLD